MDGVGDADDDDDGDAVDETDGVGELVGVALGVLVVDGDDDGLALTL